MLQLREQDDPILFVIYPGMQVEHTLLILQEVQLIMLQATQVVDPKTKNPCEQLRQVLVVSAFTQLAIELFTHYPKELGKNPLLQTVQKELLLQVRQFETSQIKQAEPILVYKVLLLQVVQLLKVEQKAQLATLHNWHRPLLNEYPGKQAVQTLIELLHAAQDGTLHALHEDPTKAKPGEQLTQTLADEHAAH